MELQNDLELLWIADEALQADDPEGWDQAEAPNGDTYYRHSVTQQVIWQDPLEYVYRQKYLSQKAPSRQCIEDPETSWTGAG